MTTQRNGRTPASERESILDDVVFEMELIRQVDITIDYILDLVKKSQQNPHSDAEVHGAITKAINASMQLRSKKDLIASFIASINAQTDVYAAWPAFVAAEKEHDLARIIASEQLNDGATRQLLDVSFRDGALRTIGTDFDRILPPLSLFSGARQAKKQRVIDALLAFFEKYVGVIRTTA